uniref:Uncharacterized protein n=1 Tax=Rhizophora mucronata TaxID=61149 RepID=A0A2P2PZS5_RHIMU
MWFTNAECYLQHHDLMSVNIHGRKGGMF